MDESLYLYFNCLNDPVLLVGCDDLIKDFSLLFPEWKFQVGGSHKSPLISIQYEDGEYRFSASWLKEVKSYIDKVDVLCELIAQFLVAKSFYDGNALYLHAAAVAINQKLIVFPSQYRAGKSLLTVCLAANGYQYFCDDVLPLTIEECKGRSLGVAPRLRLPIPDNIDSNSKDFIESRMELRGKRYAYLTLNRMNKASKDDLLEIGAFVLLSRQKGIQAQIEEIPATTIFQQLIKQNFAREIKGSLILTTLSQVISQAKCVKISYDKVDDAIKLISEHFANWPSCLEVDPHKLHASNPLSNTIDDIDKDCFLQNEGVQKVSIEGESFLSSPDGTAIYHLNQIGSGIWELLGEPTTENGLRSILSAAFPDVDDSIITKDVSTILSSFRLNNLVAIVKEG